MALGLCLTPVWMVGALTVIGTIEKNKFGVKDDEFNL